MLTNIGVALCFVAAIGILVWIVRRVIVTKRQEKENELALAAIAPQLGLSLVVGTGVIKIEASGFTSSLFTGGFNARTDHALEGRINGADFVVFNYTYQERYSDEVNTYTQTVAAFAAPKNPLPSFVLRKKNLFSKMTFKKIHVENNPDFDTRFVLTGADSAAVQRLFSPNLAGFLVSTNAAENFVLEGSGPWLVLWQKGSMRADGLRGLLEETSNIASGFFQNCGAVETAKACMNK